MKLLIRESIPIDEATIEAVALAATSATHLTEAGRFWDSPCQFQRWIAKWNGPLVAFADYTQAPEAPSEFWVNVCVHPDAQGRGIGSALYSHLLNALRPLGPLALKARLHPERAEAVRFLTLRGYSVESRVRQPNDQVTFVKLFRSNRDKELSR